LTIYLQAFGEGLESILSDYDDNSCFISQEGLFRAMAEIRTFFVAFIEGMPEGMMDVFKVTKTEVDGEIAYITWEALPWVPLGTDTFVIRDDKIIYQTLAVHSNE